MTRLALTALAVTLPAAPLAVEAQPAGKVVEGQNLVIERRYSARRDERLPDLALPFPGGGVACQPSGGDSCSPQPSTVSARSPMRTDSSHRARERRGSS